MSLDNIIIIIIIIYTNTTKFIQGNVISSEYIISEYLHNAHRQNLKSLYHYNKKSCDTVHNSQLAKILGVQILHCHKKGPHLNTIDRFHIHIELLANNQLNEDHAIFPNAIFDILSRTNYP
jgi:hypothetical protein